MRLSKATWRLLWLLQVFVFLSVMCLGQAKYIVKQNGAEKIIEEGMNLAYGKIGIVENPPKSNSGREVEMFLNSVGLKKGNPWCAAFCHWVFQTAAKNRNLTFDFFKSGHSLTLLTHASKSSKITFGKARFGDWVIFRRGETNRGHTALTVSLSGDTLITIDGNCSSPSGENDGVFLKKRSIKKFGWLVIKGFIRFGE